MLPSEYCYSSGAKAADAQIADEAGFFYGIIINSHATEYCDFTIYDSTEESGTKLFPTTRVIAKATNRLDYAMLLPYPVAFDTGCYVGIAKEGSGVLSFTVLYRLKGE